MLIKFLHTADIHLDSSMSSCLPKDKAKERKNELLLSFENMVKYAEKEGIHYILIAGDLFDKAIPSEKTVRFVEKVIIEHPSVGFYYLKGNHDDEGIEDRISMPPNLYTFNEERWKEYAIEQGGKKICIYGTEPEKDKVAQRLAALEPREEDINIVMLHGQEYEYSGNDKDIHIDLPRLKGKAIDYLALGHVHAGKIAKLDARGVYAYCGCPEGRGFDEIGPKGFNVVTIDTMTGKVDVEFVESCVRQIREIYVDVSRCNSTAEALSEVRKVVKEKINQELISCNDIVKIRLSGDLQVEAEIDADLITKSLEGLFYYIKTVDETGRVIDYNAYKNDMSLKGEFVRQVEQEDSLSQAEKAEIIRTGILLLSGRKEEV